MLNELKAPVNRKVEKLDSISRDLDNLNRSLDNLKTIAISLMVFGILMGGMAVFNLMRIMLWNSSM